MYLTCKRLKNDDVLPELLYNSSKVLDSTNRKWTEAHYMDIK